MCLWAIFIYSHIRPAYFPAAEQSNRSEEYLNRSQKHECRNWDCSRQVPFLVSNFRYCVFAVHSVLTLLLTAFFTVCLVTFLCFVSLRNTLRSPVFFLSPYPNFFVFIMFFPNILSNIYHIWNRFFPDLTRSHFSQANFCLIYRTWVRYIVPLLHT